MPNNLASFAIHCDDVSRARVFYEKVFGWKFEPWGPPDFYLIHTGDDKNPGIQGLLQQRREKVTPGSGINGWECTVSVEDVDDIAARVKAAGGKIWMEKCQIPTVGWLIRFHDTEGNDCGAMKYETRPHT